MKIKNHSEYTERVVRGTKIMRDSTIVVCGMVRDTADRVPSMIDRAEKVLALFKDYRILMVENDSSDKTRELLLEWARVNTRVTILGCGVNSAKCTLSLPKTESSMMEKPVTFGRIKKMSILREEYLNYAKKNYADFDYLSVWDMDIIGNLYVDGIQNSLGWMKDLNADAICAYGIYDWGMFNIYYDTFAHRDLEAETEEGFKLYHHLKKGIGGSLYSLGDNPVQVHTCFSGFTIYSLKSILESEAVYTIPDEEDVKCEHTLFHEHFYANNRPGKVYMNPSMIYHVILND